MYFQSLPRPSKKLKLIDFAPHDSLRNYLKKDDFIEYRCADLFMDDVDDKVDLTDMSIYESNTIDMFICSHILEHIKDDVKAMRELYRILKVGGWGIVMVPILLSLNDDFEEDRFQSDDEKWKYFMQDDHVRMYSKTGFLEKLRSVGFNIKELGESYFGKDSFYKHGIQSRSVLYVVEK
jgi:predicted SAM-dependent methyltransferase